MDDDLSTDLEGGHTPVRDAITAQNSDVEDSKRCEKAIDSSHKLTKRRKVLTSSQRQSNVEPDNDAGDENYEVPSKTRREENSSKTRDEKLIREKPDRSSSCKDSGRKTGSRRQSPTDEEDYEQEKENSDNQGLNGYGRDIYKEQVDAWTRLSETYTRYFEERLRRAEMRSALIIRELEAKVGLEPFDVSDNESGDKHDGGAHKERPENQNT